MTEITKKDMKHAKKTRKALNDALYYLTVLHEEYLIEFDEEKIKETKEKIPLLIEALNKMINEYYIQQSK